MKPYLEALVRYAIRNGLVTEADSAYAYNALLAVMELDAADGEATVELPHCAASM